MPDSGEQPRNDDQRPSAPPRMRGGLFFWLLMFIGVILLVTLMMENIGRDAREVTMAEFYDRLYAGKIAKVVIEDKRVQGEFVVEDREDEVSFAMAVRNEQIGDLTTRIVDWNRKIKSGEGVGQTVELDNKVGGEFAKYVIGNLLIWVVPILIIWYFLARHLRGAGMGSGLLNFGKSRARMLTRERTGVTFDDVAGIDEAKEEVQEIVEFLQNPGKSRRLGGRIPRGVLLVGEPGTGKTLLAKAIGGEADVPFYSISGSDFVEMFVGVGASRVRDLFHQAKENSPAIVFLDEIDAVGRRRGSGLGGGHDEREQTLNAILVEMDGFDRNENVIIIAATNRADVLDPALLRPGRFDREIIVDLPDIRGREAILRVHAKRYKLADNVDLGQLARSTPTYSGADLEAILNEAALLATRRDKDAVEMDELVESRDKVRFGREKRSRVMDEEDRKITAHHEGGHALVARLLPEAESPHKVTIIPQGHFLGATMQLPEKDQYHLQRRQILARIAVALAGRIAEELFCDDISAGAQSDLEMATGLARAMVCRWGMSDVLGPVSYHEGEDTLFLGREITRHRTHSEAMAIKIDDEIHRVLVEQYERARKLIEGNRDKTLAIVEALMKYEVLYAEDLDVILAGKELVKNKPPRQPAPEPRPEASPKGKTDAAEPSAPAGQPRPAEGIP